jgi:hypothetical protein
VNPSEINTWAAFIILGVPFITVFGGPFGWCAMWIFASVALFALHPAFAIILGLAWLLLFGPLRFVLKFLVGGYALGLGAGFALRPRYPRRSRWTRDELNRHDVEGRRGPSRAVGRRVSDYAPFDDNLDNLGD